MSTDDRLSPERLLTRDEVRTIDKTLIARGVPGVLLMENAGRGAAEVILERTRSNPLRDVAVLVGPGNNGGDGLVVARHLRLHLPDVSVVAWCMADPAQLAGDAAVMRDAATACGVPLRVAADDPHAAALALGACDCVVDALFGTGLSRPIEGAAATWVLAANARKETLRVALDVPSGIDADRGAVVGDGAAFRADVTVTFAAQKAGLHTGPGRVLAGEVVLATLGVAIPTSVARSRCWLESTAPRTPSRRPDAHKGDAGRVLVVGGRRGMTGAAVLAARGAHRMGAGVVAVASTEAPSAQHLAETMVTTLPADAAARDAKLRKMLQRADAVVLGPGLGRDEAGSQIAATVLGACEAPLVIDADGLWHLAALGLMPAAGRAWVLTPHPLEMSRLLGVDTKTVNDDRVGSARRAAGLFNAWVVLKGPGTVLSDAGSTWVMPYMTPALAVGGSGDVLAGAIAARLAERNSDGPIMVRTRVASAVHAHGRAGERLAAQRGASRGALATEVADLLAAVLEPD
jgi:hydroxyethylthiazole kinase-like uncharacterized protein yjeF